MIKLGMIADDLTGSSDAGVQFTRQGFNAVVCFDPGDINDACMETDVIVVDTDSRAIPASEAYDRVHAAAAKFSQWNVPALYKKLDSTLRGNLGAEIDAVMDVTSYPIALVAPAFPRLGRTTVDGMHYLHGVPIHKTEISMDPKCPVTESNIVRLLSSQSKRQVGLLDRDTLAQGREAVIKKLFHLKKDTVSVIVCDAVDDEDLRRLAEYGAHFPEPVLWVGSAGLADFIPVLLPKQEANRIPIQINTANHPVMLVCGSLSAVTKRQADAFAEASNVTSVSLDPCKLIAESTAKKEELQRCIKEIEKAWSRGNDILLRVKVYPLNTSDAFDRLRLAVVITEALGHIAAEVIRTLEFSGVILTGGDTAKAVCKYAGVSGVELLDEIEPGIPLSRMIGKSKLLTVTKAGAFGTDQSLVHAKRVLKGEITNG